MASVIVKSKPAPTKRNTKHCIYKRKIKSASGRTKLVYINAESTALTLLLKYKVINTAMYQAALTLAKYRNAIFHSPFAQTPSYKDKVDHSYHDPAGSALDSDENLEKEYNDLVNRLKIQNRLGAQEVINLAIYDRLPGWFTRPYKRPSDPRRHDSLIRSLTLLVDYFSAKD